MSTARTGRRPVKRIIALTLVVGISLVAGIATVWRLSVPGDGSAAPAVHAATLPDQEDPGEDVAADEDTRHEPQATRAPAATPQAGGPTSWVSRGSPSRMVTVRPTSLDVVVDGRVSRRVAFAGTSVTLAELDRSLPADWLTMSDGTATLSATVVLTRGATLDVAGSEVRTLALAGGAAPADAASIHTGGGALTLTGVTVTSVDPATGQLVPATAAGRPSIVASSGGRLEGTDITISDLGTPVAGDDDGLAAVVFNPGSTGFLTRTTLLRGSTGIKLLRSQGVRLTDIAISESSADGLVLSGDRGTTLSGIRAERNGGNGVLVTGQSSDRPITGIATAGNGEYGFAINRQAGARVVGVTTTGERAGGLEVSRSSDLVVTDLTATDQRVGVYTHVSSSGIVLDRVRTTGGRWGVAVEKSTHGLEITDSTFQGAAVAGVSIGGQQTTLTGVQVRNSQTAVRIERGAKDTQLTNLALSGGRDGVVAKSGTTGTVITGLVADNVASDAIRTAAPGTRIVGGQITGGTTGIDAEAATTITDTVINAAESGIRSSSPDLVQATGVAIDTLDVGINAAEGGPFVLADSQVHALESIRGEVNYQGVNDLSLPPLNVISVIGLPLVLVAFILERIHSARQRRYRREQGDGQAQRRTPTMQIGAT